MKEKELEIIKYYGINNQLRKLQEETFELSEAILDIEHILKEPYSHYINHIAEEIGDVMVLLEEFKEYYEIKDEKIKNNIEYKINRQLNRMKGEQN